MIQFFNKLRKSKKGFTLLELIVVLVILCILAAVAFPTYRGFIDQANGAQYVAEARECYLAGQVLVTKGKLTATTTFTHKYSGTDAIQKEFEGLVSDITTEFTAALTVGSNKITNVVYTVYNDAAHTKVLYTITIDYTSGGNGAATIVKA